jgi:hypothetical protein
MLSTRPAGTRVQQETLSAACLVPCFPPLILVQYVRLDVGAGLVLRKGSKSEVGLDNAEVGEEGLGLVVLDGGVDNDIVTGYPVDGATSSQHRSRIHCVHQQLTL